MSQPTSPGRAPEGVVVIIPALHPEPGFAGFAAQLAASFTEVLVVDDGSGADYADIFARIAHAPGCRVLTHTVNRGKGAALKTAYADLLARRPARVIVTADCDGQHTADGIAAVAAAVQAAGPEQVLVLGVRRFSGPGIPFFSRLGNGFTTGVIRMRYGQRLPDTQTGLRGFPLALAEPMSRVEGERFEYEMSVLIWALAQHIPILEVPIATVYHDAKNSQSHFRPLRDSLMIYRTILRQARSRK